MPCYLQVFRSRSNKIKDYYKKQYRLLLAIKSHSILRPYLRSLAIIRISLLNFLFCVESGVEEDVQQQTWLGGSVTILAVAGECSFTKLSPADQQRQ